MSAIMPNRPSFVPQIYLFLLFPLSSLFPSLFLSFSSSLSSSSSLFSFLCLAAACHLPTTPAPSSLSTAAHHCCQSRAGRRPLPRPIRPRRDPPSANRRRQTSKPPLLHRLLCHRPPSASLRRRPIKGHHRQLSTTTPPSPSFASHLTFLPHRAEPPPEPPLPSSARHGSATVAPPLCTISAQGEEGNEFTLLSSSFPPSSPAAAEARAPAPPPWPPALPSPASVWFEL